MAKKMFRGPTILLILLSLLKKNIFCSPSKSEQIIIFSRRFLNSGKLSLLFNLSSFPRKKEKLT